MFRGFFDFLPGCRWFYSSFEEHFEMFGPKKLTDKGDPVASVVRCPKKARKISIKLVRESRFGDTPTIMNVPVCSLPLPHFFFLPFRVFLPTRPSFLVEVPSQDNRRSLRSSHADCESSD